MQRFIEPICQQPTRLTEALGRVQGPSELAARLVNSGSLSHPDSRPSAGKTPCQKHATAVRQNDPKRVVDVLADYSTLEVGKRWEALKKHAGRAKLLGRVGILGEADRLR